MRCAGAFADRRYESDGTLRSRKHPDALIHDPAEAAQQALTIVQGNLLVGGARPYRPLEEGSATHRQVACARFGLTISSSLTTIRDLSSAGRGRNLRKGDCGNPNRAII